MKRLVLCCDGTWNKADQQQNGTLCPTNVVKLAFRVAKRAADGTPQIVYYDQGVGTGNAVDRLSGGAFGDGLEDNIYDAYRFLIANYEPGDEIYLFGFSRGAFTARSIGGMIRKCGILDRACVQRYVEARDLYRTSTVHPDDQQAVDFRGTSCCCAGDPIKIKCIGVWDTVGALGIPLRGLRWLTRRDNTFHDTELSGTVENGFHALAIDEHRSPFEPTLWMEKPKDNQRILQTWFVGAHSDVGGGYAESGLSDISLAWMLENVASVGLELDTRVETAYRVHGDPRGTLHNSKTGLYSVTKGIDRRITLGGTQSLHPSVIERWHADQTYRPASLRGLI
jgi:uncharacterized protein (DUF2235 family)